jgi:hypothetical protein
MVYFFKNTTNDFSNKGASRMSAVYEKVLAEAQQLPLNECLMLMEQLAHKLRTSADKGAKKPRWEDAAGTAPYPLCSEDAQSWVSSSRMESDITRNVV